jgi:hypothetical protein
VLFLLAHLSTFYYEHRVMSWGKAAALKMKFTRL